MRGRISLCRTLYFALLSFSAHILWDAEPVGITLEVELREAIKAVLQRHSNKLVAHDIKIQISADSPPEIHIIPGDLNSNVKVIRIMVNASIICLQ